MYTSPIFDLVTPSYLKAVTDTDLAAIARSTGRPKGMIEVDADVSPENYRDIADEELLPESQWRSVIEQKDADGLGLHYALSHNQDQGQEGTCVHFAAAHMRQIVYNMQYGPSASVLTSPISSYVFCAPNGRTGSSVPGALDQLAQYGQLPIDNDVNRGRMQRGYFDHVYRERGYGRGTRDLPEGWESSARHFRVDEYLRVDTIEKAVTMLLKFKRPFIGGRSGHCICYVDVVLYKGTYAFIYLNSWGDWGFSLPIYENRPAQTFGMDSMRLVETSVSRGAWGALSVLTPPWFEPSWRRR